MIDWDKPWTAEDVPPGPYYHGTRTKLEDGAVLLTDTIDPEAGDHRRVTWATTSVAAALDWGTRRHGKAGEVVYVYEVELDDPQVDVNMHRRGAMEPITSVMAASGRVVRLVEHHHRPYRFLP